MEKLEIPVSAEKKDLYRFLIANKDALIAQKKSVIKRGDGFAYTKSGDIGEKLNAVKKLEQGSMEGGVTNAVEVKAIINTTNWLDSHYDVHLPGIWDKSLKENKMILHVQEHKSREFDKIISDGDQLNAFVENTTWKSLGFDMNGKTQALVFESTVLKDRNEFMLKQYLKGWVKNHSVGMRYINIILCINDKDNGAEFEAWEKYYPMIVNKDRADDLGFFWAVKEAEVVEGSAVPLGSNIITPTMSVESKSTDPVGSETYGKSEDAQDNCNLFKNLNY